MAERALLDVLELWLSQRDHLGPTGRILLAHVWSQALAGWSG